MACQVWSWVIVTWWSPNPVDRQTDATENITLLGPPPNPGRLAFDWKPSLLNNSDCFNISEFGFVFLSEGRRVQWSWFYNRTAHNCGWWRVTGLIATWRCAATRSAPGMPLMIACVRVWSFWVESPFLTLHYICHSSFSATLVLFIIDWILLY